ncbi:hypothetical protein KFU94_17620 [Chloroflexi bacterium TSY]|nr:hypothetical protein [Chloroflexi bacterium TSY]
MAAGLIQARLSAEYLANRVEIVSAGIHAQDGQLPSTQAVDILAMRGIAIGLHSATKLQSAHIDEADLILVMEEDHRKYIFYQSPQSLHKVILLSELTDQDGDVADPFGNDYPEYERVLETIESILDKGWQRLLQLLDITPITRTNSLKSL